MFRKTGERSNSLRDSKGGSKEISSKHSSSRNESNSHWNRVRNLLFTPGGKSELIDNLKKFDEQGDKESADICLLSASTRLSTDESYTLAKSTEIDSVARSNDRPSSSVDGEIRCEHNDLSQKGDEIVIEHFTPDIGMFRDCRVASVRDFEALANELQNALQPEKSPESVYRVLYFLLREDKAIEKLEDAFKKKDGRNVEIALTERFSKGTPQLEYALELLGKKDVDRTIQQRPRTGEEYMAFAKSIVRLYY